MGEAGGDALRVEYRISRDRVLSLLGAAGRSVVLCLLFVAAACTQDDSSSQKFTGTWVMNLGERTFIVLTLKNKGDSFTGDLIRPENFETSDGLRFSHISPGHTREVIVSASLQNDHLHFVTEDPNDTEDKSEYDMTLSGKDQASIQATDVPIEAWSFTRVRDAKPPMVSADWDPRRSYSQEDSEDSAVSNAEMMRIFQDDQAARQDPGNISDQEWTVIGRQDAERQSQTRKLLADGQLHTGEDFTAAAFIFQHGSTPDDFLLAHTLAMIAVAKGDESALWIGSATLDRYLQHIGQPQIYGTQFKLDPDDPATQEPYDRDLIDDALRRRLGVPSLAAQQEQLRHWTEQFKPAAAKSK
jgi:hypothetical protein